MKKVEVIVRDKNTLVLEEAAQKGDYIDLTSISNVDYSQIEAVILSGKDQIYEKKLEEYKENFKFQIEQEIKSREAGFALEKQALTSQLDMIKKEYQNQLAKEKGEVLHQHELEIKALESQIQALNQKYANDLSIIKQEEETKHLTKIQSLSLELEQVKSAKNSELKDAQISHQLKVKELENKILSLNTSIEDKLKTNRLEVENSFHERLNLLNQQIEELKHDKEKLEISHQLELEKEKKEFKEQIDSLTQTNLQLQRQKAALNVKQTGEDLEVWCDNEVKSYMQNGLENCTWEKDNVVVRYDDETKGSKADYIFRIYTTKEKQELLTSVCLDMKDENPDSVNRKKNSDYFKALDSNRKKKDCKYAILVSNLELDKPNDLPIYKVFEYEDMYVVRPAYLMTFLNMLVSLTTRFKDLLLAKEKENLELKSKRDLEEEFEKLKNTYLDKPLESLEKNINELKKQNEGIAKASRKIDEVCDTIIRSYLNEITNKLERFDIKLNKLYR